MESHTFLCQLANKWDTLMWDSLYKKCKKSIFISMTSTECKRSCHDSDGEIISKSYLNSKVQDKVLNLLNGRPADNVSRSFVENNSNFVDMHFHISASFDHRTGIGYWDGGERIKEKYWLKRSDCECTDQVRHFQ